MLVENKDRGRQEFLVTMAGICSGKKQSFLKMKYPTTKLFHSFVHLFIYLIFGKCAFETEDFPLGWATLKLFLDGIEMCFKSVPLQPPRCPESPWNFKLRCFPFPAMAETPG